MKKIVFITPSDAEFGFGLTGVRQLLSDRESLSGSLNSVTSEDETGMVIVDERLINSENEEHIKELEKTWSGILLVLPSPERPGAEVEDYASRLIRRAIGYHVRLNI